MKVSELIPKLQRLGYGGDSEVRIIDDSTVYDIKEVSYGGTIHDTDDSSGVSVYYIRIGKESDLK
jgi:hypothetical protein